ncbi:MAG: type II secretion system F family protein [Nanoarchaeota archaeon]
MYRFFAAFYPKKLRGKYVQLLRFSNIKINPDRFVGFLIAFGLLLSFVVVFYSSFALKLPVVVSFIGFFVLFEVIVYFWLLLRADSKAKFVEQILPDLLQLMASNLRAGLTTDKALLLSARPEFGFFREEINKVGKKVTMGSEISDALVEMSINIKSEKLSKTVELIVSGLSSGGELASLLEQTAHNLRKEGIIDSRIRANVMMYVILIFAAVCFGSPVLFGLSTFLVEVMTTMLGTIQLPDSSSTSLPISFSEVTIDPAFVVQFSVVFLITSSILGSLILGLISKGKEREGIRYVPIVIAVSLAVFFIARIVISSLLGGLFGF